MISLSSHQQPENWNAIIENLPGPHLLQTREWAIVKERFGWQASYQVWQDGGRVIAAALVLLRRLTLRNLNTPFYVIYAPKGPLLDWTDPEIRKRVIKDLASLARQTGALFIKIDPDVRLGTGIPRTASEQDDPLGQVVSDELKRYGWRYSDEQVQFRNTILVDLTLPEEGLLANMKPKTRYNIRLAQRKGVEIRQGTGADLDLLYQLYAETCIRDGFVIREQEYLHKVWATFIEAGMAEALIAEVGREPVAGLVIFHFAGKAWYLYGMSADKHREKMPNHLLQWEAMRRAKHAGCQTYDLWGIPDEFVDSDPMWGVYRFKEGFGGEVVRHIGAWDLPVRAVLYNIYTRTTPALLEIMRQQSRSRLRKAINIQD